ncbi:MAG: AAA family ATPase [Pseudomonadota bacterium]
MTGDVRDWLAEHGLEAYVDDFIDNEITLDLLPELAEDDLKELGLSLGARKRFLRAVAGGGAAKAETQAPSPGGAERRQLTVMFCDLVGSTALSSSHDPEDLRALMVRYQDTVVDAVTRYEGHVAQHLGDGVLAYFGWPRAFEDAAERAVRAGREAVAAVGRLRTSAGAPLGARVGIATGSVVVGALDGQTGKDAELASGQAPNLAARLEGIAQTGEVVICDSTQRLMGARFELEDGGMHAVKGFDLPAQVWRIGREIAGANRFDSSRRATMTKLIGRRRELAIMQDAWRRALSGQGGAVVISGEPGIGKSRLIEALRETAILDQPLVQRYQCSPYHATTHLFPTVQYLERAAHFSPDDDPEARLDKLEQFLGGWSDGDLAKVGVADIAAMLSLPHEGRYGPLPSSPAQARTQLLDRIVSLLRRVSDEAPLLMLYEDAHWIDPTSLALMQASIEGLRGKRALLVVTHRPEAPPDLPDDSRVTRLTLDRLNTDQGTELVRAIIGDLTPEETLSRILARTDGVPLFIEELTKTLLEEGLGLADAEIPESLQALLLDRIDRLGAEAKGLVQLASVVGREFSQELLATASDLPEPEFQRSLGRLIESGLIHPAEEEDGENLFKFKHAMLQDGAYDSLIRSRRQALHGRIADTMTERFPDIANAQPAIVAQHLSSADRAEDAASAWLMAGYRAAALSANAEACDTLERGLKDLERLPPGPDRDAKELDLLVAMLSPLIAANGYAARETRQLSERAIGLCRQTGRSGPLFPALYGQWVVTYVGGDARDARAMAMDYLRLAKGQDDIAPRMIGARLAASSLFIEGDPAQAWERLEQSAALYDPERGQNSAVSYGQDVGVTLLCWRCLASCMNGFPDNAASFAEQAMARAREVDHANTTAWALVHLAIAAHILRDRQRFFEHVSELSALSDEHDLPLFQALATLMTGLVEAQQGMAEEGLATFEKGLEMVKAVRFRIFRPLFMTMHAELLAALGRVDEALERVSTGLDFAERRGEPWTDPELLRLRAVMLSETGDMRGARATAKAALDAARRRGMRWWRLRAAITLAELAERTGDGADARSALEAALALADQGGGAPDVDAGRAVLARLAA